jgi:hypothetical protein
MPVVKGHASQEFPTRLRQKLIRITSLDNGPALDKKTAKKVY